MSENADARFDPAIGLLEFDSIVAGIVGGDAMAKSSPVASLYAGTVHPGRYLVLVGGDTAAVEIAVEAGGTNTVVDSLLLANVHPAVVAAITGVGPGNPIAPDAIGVVETSSVAAAIVAADAGVKAAQVSLAALGLGDDLGGKAYCVFAGPVADVEAAVERAELETEHRGKLLATAIIPQIHRDMVKSMARELRFNHQLQSDLGAP